MRSDLVSFLVALGLLLFSWLTLLGYLALVSAFVALRIPAGGIVDAGASLASGLLLVYLWYKMLVKIFRRLSPSRTGSSQRSPRCKRLGSQTLKSTWTPCV